MAANNAVNKNAPPEAAFAKAHSFARVVAQFRQAAGLSVIDGTSAEMPAGGTAVFFNQQVSVLPWTATRISTGLRLANGFIAWAGRVMFFPAADYNGNGSGAVMLKVPATFSTTNLNPDPWKIQIVDTTEPVLEWKPAGTIGSHARVTNPAAETITVTNGTIYIPIVSWDGARVIQHVLKHFSVAYRANGSAYIAGNWS